MTAPATTPQQPVRIAAYFGACGACNEPIRPGQVIRKPPGKAWQHDRCAKPKGGNQ